MGREKTRLEEIAKSEGWAYKSQDPNSKWEPTFNLDENHKQVLAIDKKMRKLSRAINATNNIREIDGINDTDYGEWL